MASGRFDLGKTLGVSAYMYSRCEWSSYTRQNENDSVMNVKVIVGKRSGSNEATRCTMNTYVSVSGSREGSQAEEPNTILSVSAGQEFVVFDKNFIVPHEGDGSKTCVISASIGNNGVYHSAGSSQVTLDVIPRETPLPAFEAGYVEGTYIIGLTPLIANATHSIELIFGDTKSDVIANRNVLKQWVQSDGSLGASEVKLTGSNPSVTFPTEYYKYFNGSTGYGKFTLNTYNGNTLIGSNAKWFKISCDPSRCTPTITATAIDNNPITVALTGDENTIIANASHVLVTPTIQPSDVDDTNALVTSKAIDSVVFTTDTAVLLNATKKDFLLSATNNRGLTGYYTTTATGGFIPYISLTFNIDELYRPEPTQGKIILKYSGKFYSGNFSDGIANELSLWWKYKANRDEEYTEGGVLTPIIDTEKHTYSGEVELGDIFDYQQQYDFQFFYKDKIIGIDDSLYTPAKVTRGIPVYWWTADSFHIEGDLYVNDVKILDSNSGDNGPSGIVYSTNEQAVGTWINGKPVYRKTFTGSLVNLSTTWNNLYQVNDVDETIDLTGSISNTGTDGRSLNANTWEDESHNCTFSHCKADDNMLQVRVTGWSNPTWAFVFKLHFLYTKTTDVATRSINIEEG